MVARASSNAEQPARGRYVLAEPIAAGGMATVYFARLHGTANFQRTVAVKKLHTFLANDADFVSMLLDEARLVARVRHPNVVPTLDVVAEGGELLLVMEYVYGESLAAVLRTLAARDEEIPLPVLASIVSGALYGLHAAHEATWEDGSPLHIVHRDVSPQNILVGADGLPRVLDFGVAKAVGRLHSTRGSAVKGKLRYMPPEILDGKSVTRQADLYSTAVVLWETIVGRHLFRGETEAAIVASVLSTDVAPPSRFRPEVPPALDALILRGLSRDPSARFESARAMAAALDRAVRPASAGEVAEWLAGAIPEGLAARREQLARVERGESTPSASPAPEGPVTAVTRRQPTVSAERSVPSGEASSVSAATQPTTAPAARPGWTTRALVVASIGVLAIGAAALLRSRAPAAPPAWPQTSSAALAVPSAAHPDEGPATAAAPPPIADAPTAVAAVAPPPAPAPTAREAPAPTSSAPPAARHPRAGNARAALTTAHPPTAGAPRETAAPAAAMGELERLGGRD